MEIVPFLLAKKLKEKGFREKVEHFYDRFGNDWRCLEPSNMNDTENCSAPTISQVLKWLREEKKLHISIEYGYEETPVWDFEIRLIGNYARWWTDETYSSYELAVLAGVEYCLDNLI